MNEFPSLLKKSCLVSLFVHNVLKTSDKGKEVKGSEKADEFGHGVSSASRIFLWLRRTGEQRNQSKMPKMRSSVYD